MGESPVLIVDMRPQGDIQTDLNDARALKPRAEADEQRANAALIQSKATLAIKKSERESLDDRTDAAKKTGNEAEAATLDREREESDLRVKLEERFVGVREIQLELARARKAFADRSVAALEAELEMAKKVENWDAVTRSSVSAASAPEIVGLQVAIRGDERRVLKAMKERADQAEEVAKKDRELVESQLRVLESDTAILDFATRARWPRRATLTPVRRSRGRA